MLNQHPHRSQVPAPIGLLSGAFGIDPEGRLDVHATGVLREAACGVDNVPVSDAYRVTIGCSSTVAASTAARLESHSVHERDCGRTSALSGRRTSAFYHY